MKKCSFSGSTGGIYFLLLCLFLVFWGEAFFFHLPSVLKRNQNSEFQSLAWFINAHFPGNKNEVSQGKPRETQNPPQKDYPNVIKTCDSLLKPSDTRCCKKLELLPRNIPLKCVKLQIENPIGNSVEHTPPYGGEGLMRIPRPNDICPRPPTRMLPLEGFHCRTVPRSVLCSAEGLSLGTGLLPSLRSIWHSGTVESTCLWNPRTLRP